MNVYQYVSGGPAPASPTPAPISMAKIEPVISDATDLGCYTDSSSGLIMALTLTDSEMTTEVTVLSGRDVIKESKTCWNRCSPAWHAFVGQAA